MRLHRSILLAASAAFPLGSALAQAPFEGIVNLRMTSENSTTEGTVYVKGPRSRMEFSTGGQQMYMVMDAEKSTSMMVMPAQRVYMVIDVKAVAEQMRAAQGRATPEVKVELTGRKETVAGHECEHYTITSAESVTDACMARGIGSFHGVVPPPTGGRGPDIPPELRELATRFKDGGFLLKAETTVNGQTRMTMVVTKIEKKSVEAAMFEAPAGFQNMSGMVPGMGRRPPGSR